MRPALLVTASVLAASLPARLPTRAPTHDRDLVTLAVPRAVGARADSTIADRMLARRIDAYVRPLADSGRFAGVVLVAQGGRVRFERAYGLASVELGVPNTPATRFRIFSITKQFTAAAILQLVARGQVDLDASVRTYLPELPAAWQGATVAQMLTHTSGIPNLEEGAWVDSLLAHDAPRQLDNLARVAPALARVPLAEAPGTKSRYNNFAYDLLACVVERASGRPFAEYMAAEVFRPAGMSGAGFDARAEAGGVYVSSAVVLGLASGYNGVPERLQVAAPKEFAQAGAGGMYATARDLWRYDEALTRGAVVPVAQQRVAIARAVRVGKRSSYGYGWVVTRAGDGADSAAYFLHHSGGTNGYVSEYARYPREGVCIVVLANRGDTGFADPEAMRATVAEMLFGDRYRPSSKR